MTSDRPEAVKEGIDRTGASRVWFHEQVIEMTGHRSSQRTEVGTVVGQANRGPGRVPDQQRLDVMVGVGDPGPDAIKLLVRDRLLVEVGVAAVELTQRARSSGPGGPTVKEVMPRI